ncbi:unnamed protein product [Peronospora belbahrii]|uniref:Uncharacterized protein n=1 Tax=Peronospora belbahrii TaxID=622444 RepID=A0AAU9L0G0_9STRA|nr:unnamed protein product [Peronospora belbahrii]CAH0516569.1 unnamed protein product [Peronospora belbahrii]
MYAGKFPVVLEELVRSRLKRFIRQITVQKTQQEPVHIKMEHVRPTIHRQQRLFYEEKDTSASQVQLIRRKRPRTPELDHGTVPTRGSREKTPRLMMLPGLAELLAAQKQRNEGVVSDDVLDVMSRVSTVGQEQQQQMQLRHEEEIELEDKTPWPSATQYYDILMTHKTKLKIPVYDLGVDPRGVPLHPEFIYSQPVSCMYFLKCSRLLGKGSFGFPRKRKTASEMICRTISTNAGTKSVGSKKELSKEFEWRKMSFVTGLPKKQPIVRYITATCYSRATDIAVKKKVLRMHAVMLADGTGTGENGEYVLVHIRAGGSKRVGLRVSLVDSEIKAAPASPGACGTVNAKQRVGLLCMRRPVSPTSVAVSSYSSATASTSPHNANFSAIQGESSDDMAMASTVSPMKVSLASAVTRHTLFSTTEDLNIDLARLVLRNMILKSCTSPDEMAKYVLGLQEELTALQSQYQSSKGAEQGY